MAGNKEYKSDVFSMLLEDKQNALQIYNALNNTAYEDTSLIEVHTLNKGVSLSVRNDAAFVVDSNLSVYEHQSTICPNMPLRCLLYVSSILQKIVKRENIYGKSLIKIPTSKFAVFYNGIDEQPEQQELRLSNAFESPVNTPELELTCKVYNTNYGNNMEFLEKCPVLREYMIFVNYVRNYHGMDTYDTLEEAINLAIDRCIREDILREFLSSNRSEVLKVMQMDYTFERQIELEREASRGEGYAEGHAAGEKSVRQNTLLELVRDGLLNAAEAAKRLSMSEDDIIKMIKS